MPEPVQIEFKARREKRLKYYGTLTFAVLIAAIGWVMMTLTSSPAMKGAAFLWLPAALQLIAGVWLGPIEGFIAGGLGAYAAGILAYGGWGLPDIIMNPIAGGLANSMLPGLLFRMFRIDPALGAKPRNLGIAILRIVAILIVVILLTLLLQRFGLGLWGYLPQVVILFLAPFYLRELNLPLGKLTLAFAVCVISSFISALIGSVGAKVGGLSWEGAFVGVGAGWFLGDTVSSLFGLYMMAALTDRAESAGLLTERVKHA